MILVCGEALVDLLATPQPDGDASLDLRLGGAPFNLAISLARLGRRVAFFGGVSTDPLGAAQAGRLAREGVETSLLQRSDATTMLAIVGVGRDGHPAYSFPIVDGADKHLVLPAVPPEIRADLAAAAFGSYLAMLEPTATLMRQFASSLRHDAVICLDPNIRPSIERDPRRWLSGLEGFLELTDVIKASEEDIRTVYGPGADLAAVASGWLARGPSLAVVTRGADGALAVLRGGETVEIRARPVKVVDTVGAGDAFFAGLIDGLARRGLLSRERLTALGPADAAEGLGHAATVAAIACTRRGADLPTLADLRQMTVLDADPT